MLELEIKGTLSCRHGYFRFSGTDESGNRWYGSTTLEDEDSMKGGLGQLFNMIRFSEGEVLAVKITITPEKSEPQSRK